MFGRLLLLSFSFVCALSVTTGAHAAGEVQVCFIETGKTDAGRLREDMNGAAEMIGATIEAVQVGVKRDADLRPTVDLFVAGSCHLIVVTSKASPRAILVLSAADGPMPQTRQAAELVGKLGYNDIVVFVHRLDLNNDPELLELIRLEMRELMSSKGLPGDSIRFEQCTPKCRGEVLLPGS
jgi:translation elongation factor EF-Tu-like GTPase